MSDLPVVLPSPESAESIPAALAAVRGKRKGKRPVSAEPFVGAPATFADDPAPSLPPAAAPATPATEEFPMATTIENAVDTAGANTQAMFGDLNANANGTMEKGAAMLAELNSFGKGNVEALVESGKIAAAGLQTLTQAQTAYVRKQFEDATAAARTMAAVKSPTDFVKLQGDYVRQQFDALIAETSRSTETMLKLAGEVVQPLSNRYALAAEKLKQSA